VRPTGASEDLTALPGLLRDWLPGRRWFAEKGRPLTGVAVASRHPLPAAEGVTGLEVLVLAVSFASCSWPAPRTPRPGPPRSATTTGRSSTTACTTGASPRCCCG
jgi:hypothetical protein